MPNPVHAVVRFQVNSGVNRDAINLDFNFADASPNVDGSLIQFFNNTWPPATGALGSFLSPWVSRATNASMIELYNATPPVPPATGFGPPFKTVPWTLAPTVNNPAPAEICVAFSVHAIDSSIPEHGPGTRPKSRYRGRIYFGPLGTNSLHTDTVTKRCFVDSTLTTTGVAAMKALLSVEPTWGVWSRRDHVIRPIVGGWIDDDFDVQRRRGPDAQARVVWP